MLRGVVRKQHHKEIQCARNLAGLDKLDASLWLVMHGSIRQTAYLKLIPSDPASRNL